jgi:hypothetical protein
MTNASTSAAAFSVGNFGKGESRMDLTKQWMARPHDQRFLSLDSLRLSVEGRAKRSKELLTPSKSIELLAPAVKTVEDTHRMTVGLSNGDEVALTHWSFGQLCSLIRFPASHYRDLPSQLVTDPINYGLRHMRSVEALKTYSTEELLAVTGPDYGRIFDHEVVSAVQQVAGNGVGDTRWKIPGTLDWASMKYDPETPVTLDTTTLYASDRDVFIFLVDDRNPIEVGKLPNGDPDLMFRGFYITNSEVGNSALKLCAFYLRAVCCNRIMWGVEGFQEITMRHSKLAPARFVEECRPALQGFADGSETKLIEGVRRAKEAKLATDRDEALAFLQGRDFSKKKALEILEIGEREENRPVRTAWDFAQAITAAARNVPNTDDRVEMENISRKILDKVA